jgi:hypothetical protein
MSEIHNNNEILWLIDRADINFNANLNWDLDFKKDFTASPQSVEPEIIQPDSPTPHFEFEITHRDIVQEKTDYAVSFFYRKDFFVACAEASMMEKKDVLSYLDISLIDEKDMSIIQQTLAQSQSAWFFNVLNVSTYLRKKGIGRLLVEKMTEFCRENNAFLLNAASSYGENGLNQQQLVAFYEKSGMLKLNAEGLMIYHGNLSQMVNNKK